MNLDDYVGILNPDNYAYGSDEYYKALFQRLSLLKNKSTEMSSKRVKNEF